MQQMKIKVCKIDDVVDHPTNHKLSVYYINGCSLTDKRHLYHKGSLVVFIPAGVFLPEWLSTYFGFGHNVVITIKHNNDGVMNHGFLYPVLIDEIGIGLSDKSGSCHYVIAENNKYIMVELGDDLTSIFGC